MNPNEITCWYFEYLQLKPKVEELNELVKNIERKN